MYVCVRESIVETEGRSGSPGQILISMAEADKVAAGLLQQAIGVLRNIFHLLKRLNLWPRRLSDLQAHLTAVKPAAVQKNTVKPAAIEILVRAYYYDYGNHRNNAFRALFILDAQN